MKRSQLIAAVVAAVLTTLATLGVVGLVDTGDGGGKPDTATVKIPERSGGQVPKDAQPILGQPGTEVAPGSDQVDVPQSQVDQLKRTDVGGHEGNKDETPAEAPKSELAAAQDQRERIRETQAPLPTAGASAGFPGCVTRFVGNQSSRNGVRPQNITEHYTVSWNVPGWGDMNALAAQAARRSSGTSWHFVVDEEGHCYYQVPIEAKAWTTAAGNPISVNTEIIRYGTEATLTGARGLAKIVAINREVGRRTGIPMRRGGVSGCRSTRTGIVQHKDYGLCGGGHHDITPYSIDQVVKASASGAAAAATVRSKLTAYNRKILDRRFYHWKGYHQSTGKTKADHLRHSQGWQYFARRQKKRYDAAHAAGQPWKKDSIGTQRLIMARTERFNTSDRAYLRK